MKLFITPALQRHPYYSSSLVAHKLPSKDYTEYRYWVCLDITRKIFNLPLNITKVWFEFHDQPGVDRWLVEVVSMDHTSEAVLCVEGKRVLVENEMVNYLVRHLKREKVYVACWYEEEGP